MKKLVGLVVLLVVALASVLAVEGYEVKSYRTELKEKNVTIDLNFNETTKDMVVIYTIKLRTFDEGDAIAQIRDAVKLFIKENGCTNYKVLSPDVVTYSSTETVMKRFLHIN